MGPSQHRLREAEGQFRFVRQTLHRRMARRTHDSAGLVAIAGAAVHQHAGAGQAVDRQLCQRRKPIGAPGLRRTVGAIVVEHDERADVAGGRRRKQPAEHVVGQRFIGRRGGQLQRERLPRHPNPRGKIHGMARRRCGLDSKPAGQHAFFGRRPRGIERIGEQPPPPVTGEADASPRAACPGKRRRGERIRHDEGHVGRIGTELSRHRPKPSGWITAVPVVEDHPIEPRRALEQFREHRFGHAGDPCRRSEMTADRAEHGRAHHEVANPPRQYHDNMHAADSTPRPAKNSNANRAWMAGRLNWHRRARFANGAG